MDGQPNQDNNKLNKGFISKVPKGYLDYQTPKKGLNVVIIAR